MSIQPTNARVHVHQRQKTVSTHRLFSLQGNFRFQRTLPNGKLDFLSFVFTCQSKMLTTTVKHVSDLWDYNKLLKECVNGGPVILTKNGRGAYVVASIDEYTQMAKMYANTQMKGFQTYAPD